MAETWIQNLITVEYKTVMRLWTGRGDLEFGDQTWRGGGAALRVSEVETASAEPDRRVTLTLSGIPRDLRREFLQDAGPLPVTVEWIYSTDRGGTWNKVPISFRGRLSTPSLREGALTVEIETQRGDVDLGSRHHVLNVRLVRRRKAAARVGAVDLSPESGDDAGLY